ncbi:hypothetical protein CO134_03385 [Candidatus Kuenenbacteria bacterium CG_4_9_14_3_um_filter_39_14]|uniref:bAvd-like domain-containing protein n=8 Tax=Candidatus Kueneniibacteriota TaxID=1752740 RepID=A0A1F6FNA0_9BACT|nr:MAG: hypothetical protein A3B87_01855 [Candidatus Kuenenbacteria bacterium RIFCSPHIGHO2_02_FULL_39_13]OIP55763.1 MAG: hypothetical protein AUK13_02325 [Candidatus Kuenenbacteria bacterium CG2_30_39_24]PIP29204.1 MAG: hypothetical protein COX28_00350 [Candidatus Kuenenbacteria bacterium CG23_combo_of_CG06-09_8_20_14_all_39_39]PIP76069.1 MAG: hypothetical protein COW86_00120 [Candidatus Kuenenbacteria bacterium CG22_combo_CG10-13_8_21_14_all_39_9]PIR80588.1 MAG: hypothetical protein COU24_0323
MDEFDIPIFKKTYELYKEFYGFRNTVSKQDRYTIWQRCEDLILEILEYILGASQLSKIEKLPILQKASTKLNLLRVFLRLCKDTKVLDSKKYIRLEQNVDEIGRMLGGWIKSTRDR